MKYFEKTSVLPELAELVTKRNAIKKELQLASSSYKTLVETAKGNDVFTSWGKKVYKGNPNWDPKKILRELKRKKKDLNILKDKYSTIKDISYKYPQQVHDDIYNLLKKVVK